MRIFLRNKYKYQITTKPYGDNKSFINRWDIPLLWYKEHRGMCRWRKIIALYTEHRWLNMICDIRVWCACIIFNDDKKGINDEKRKRLLIHKFTSSSKANVFYVISTFSTTIHLRWVKGEKTVSWRKSNDYNGHI